jgi:hypothetical protein
VSKEIAFEVVPTEPQRITATLVDGRRVEIVIRLPVIAVTDNEADVVVNGQPVPNVNVTMAPPLVGVRVVGEEPAPLPGISVSSKAN